LRRNKEPLPIAIGTALSEGEGLIAFEGIKNPSPLPQGQRYSLYLKGDFNIWTL
jgi:hypothetical protein